MYVIEMESALILDWTLLQFCQGKINMKSFRNLKSRSQDWTEGFIKN